MSDRIYPTKCDTECPNCEEINTIYKPYKPPGKSTGIWYCDECDWSGYPKGFKHIWNKRWP